MHVLKGQIYLTTYMHRINMQGSRVSWLETHTNRGQRVTKDQYVETTTLMVFMEKENVFDKQHAKWLNIPANVHLEDRSKP